MHSKFELCYTYVQVIENVGNCIWSRTWRNKGEQRKWRNPGNMRKSARNRTEQQGEGREEICWHRIGERRCGRVEMKNTKISSKASQVLSTSLHIPKAHTAATSLSANQHQHQHQHQYLPSLRISFFRKSIPRRGPVGEALTAFPLQWDWGPKSSKGQQRAEHMYVCTCYTTHRDTQTHRCTQRDTSAHTQIQTHTTHKAHTHTHT